MTLSCINARQENCKRFPCWFIQDTCLLTQFANGHFETSGGMIRDFFYILLTVHLDITSGRWPTWHTVLLYNILISILHVSSKYMLIIRRSNCTNTPSGIVTLCKWPSGMQVELDLHTGWSLTESHYTRCCINTIDLLMMSTCLLESCRGLK